MAPAVRTTIVGPLVLLRSFRSAGPRRPRHRNYRADTGAGAMVTPRPGRRSGPAGHHRGGLADHLLLALHVVEPDVEVHQMVVSLDALPGDHDPGPQVLVGPGLPGEPHLEPADVALAHEVGDGRPEEPHREHPVSEHARLAGGLGLHLVMVHRVVIPRRTGVDHQVATATHHNPDRGLVTVGHVLEVQHLLTHDGDLPRPCSRRPPSAATQTLSHPPAGHRPGSVTPPAGHRPGSGSRGSPSSRSPMTFRCTSLVPPAMVRHLLWRTPWAEAEASPSRMAPSG